jgi:hypothetical protein
MVSRFDVGIEVKHGRGTQRMKITGLGDIEGREHAWCEWIDKEGAKHSQQYPIEELALAVDHGPRGGKWPAVRRGSSSEE